MKKIVLSLLWVYKKISFIFPVRCKYIPTCSDYTFEAFSKYPFFKASILSFCRLLRCNPFSKGGFDPLR